MNTKPTKKAEAVKTMIKEFACNFEKAKKRPCEVVYLTRDQFQAIGMQPGQMWDGKRLEAYH